MRVVQYDVKVLEVKKPIRHAWTRTGYLKGILKMSKRRLGYFRTISISGFVEG